MIDLPSHTASDRGGTLSYHGVFQLLLSRCGWAMGYQMQPVAIAMRGRVSAVNMLFIGTSNQLGEFESGTLAALIGAVPTVVLGGVGTLVVTLLWMGLFPTLRKLDRLEGPR